MGFGWGKVASKLFWILQGCQTLRLDGATPKTHFLLLGCVVFSVCAAMVSRGTAAHSKGAVQGEMAGCGHNLES